LTEDDGKPLESDGGDGIGPSGDAEAASSNDSESDDDRQRTGSAQSVSGSRLAELQGQRQLFRYHGRLGLQPDATPVAYTVLPRELGHSRADRLRVLGPRYARLA
jgi:hypothetical protein